MFNKTKAGKLADKSRKVFKVWDEFIDYYTSAKGKPPERIIATPKQIEDAFDPEYKGEKVYRNFPVVLPHQVAA